MKASTILEPLVANEATPLKPDAKKDDAPLWPLILTLLPAVAGNVIEFCNICLFWIQIGIRAYVTKYEVPEFGNVHAGRFYDLFSCANGLLICKRISGFNIFLNYLKLILCKCSAHVCACVCSAHVSCAVCGACVAAAARPGLT